MLSMKMELQIALGSTALFVSILLAASRRIRSVSRASFLISTVHAITILALTSYVIFSECWDSHSSFCNFNASSNSDVQQGILLYSMGYFITDSIVVLWVAPDLSAALHHVSILFGQFFAVFYGDFQEGREGRIFGYPGISGYALACFLFAAEVSAPFLNTFMSGLAPSGTRFEFISKALFASTFLISRLVVCPFLLYEFVVNCPNAPIVPKAVCVFVMGISVYWSKAVIAGVGEAVLPPQSTVKDLIKIEEELREKRLKGE